MKDDKKTEESKTHPDYPGYLFYNDGRVQNIKEPELYKFKSKHTMHSGKFVTQFTRKSGLIAVGIFNKNNIRTTVKLAKVIAELFVENPEGKKFAVPKDGNKSNIHYTNLEWSDAKTSIEENIKKWDKFLKE